MDHSYNILLVDDDEELRATLAEQLAFHEEFTTMAAGTGMDGLNAAKEGKFDLIILDVGLPDLDGREVCRMMRKANIKIPIISKDLLTISLNMLKNLDCMIITSFFSPLRV